MRRFSLLRATPTFARPVRSELLIDPRSAGAFGAAIVCGLLLLQYAHRRRPFILPWAAGWLLIGPALLVLTRSYGTPAVGRAAVGVSQLLGVADQRPVSLERRPLPADATIVRRKRADACFGAVAAWFLRRAASCSAPATCSCRATR